MSIGLEEFIVKHELSAFVEQFRPAVREMLKGGASCMNTNEVMNLNGVGNL